MAGITQFGSFVFLAMRNDDGGLPDFVSAKNIVRTPYATGGESIQVLGALHQRLSVRIRYDIAYQTALHNALGTTATLYIAGVSYGSCFLEEIAAVTRYIDRNEAVLTFTRAV